jgi:hypothetical protein
MLAKLLLGRHLTQFNSCATQAISSIGRRSTARTKISSTDDNQLCTASVRAVDAVVHGIA